MTTPAHIRGTIRQSRGTRCSRACVRSSSPRWWTKLSYWPEQLVDSVRRRFSDINNELSKWHMDNLYTHMCALSLFVDGWATDTTDLRNDLRMENKQISQYFLELGCKITGPTETERKARNMTKAQAAATRIAKLKLPLEFPKAARRR